MFRQCIAKVNEGDMVEYNILQNVVAGEGVSSGNASFNVAACPTNGEACRFGKKATTASQSPPNAASLEHDCQRPTEPIPFQKRQDCRFPVGCQGFQIAE